MFSGPLCVLKLGKEAGEFWRALLFSGPLCLLKLEKEIGKLARAQLWRKRIRDVVEIPITPSYKLVLSAASLPANCYLVRPISLPFFQEAHENPYARPKISRTNIQTIIKCFSIRSLAAVGTTHNVGHSGRTAGLMGEGGADALASPTAYDMGRNRLGGGGGRAAPFGGGGF